MLWIDYEENLHYYVNRYILKCLYLVCSQTILGLVSFFLALVIQIFILSRYLLYNLLTRLLRK